MTSESLSASKAFYQRLLLFATGCQQLVANLPRNIWNTEYGSQLIRASSSPGANYTEAVEATSHKDFTYRLKICRKESKESIHWLTLIKNLNTDYPEIQSKIDTLINEPHEFVKIFSSSINTSERNRQQKKKP
jgi:four helix bundle protein